MQYGHGYNDMPVHSYIASPLALEECASDQGRARQLLELDGDGVKVRESSFYRQLTCIN